MVNFSTLWQFVLHLYLLCWTEVWLLGVQYCSIMFLIRFKKKFCCQNYILRLVHSEFDNWKAAWEPWINSHPLSKIKFKLIYPISEKQLSFALQLHQVVKKIKIKLFHDIWGCLIQCKSIICSKWDTQNNRSFSNANCFRQEYCNINYVHYVC